MTTFKLRFRIALIFTACITIFSACSDNEPFVASMSDGIIIINEGAFNSGNGEISFLRNNSTAPQNDLFSKVNGRPLGDVVQSATIINDRLFIVVNNSGKVEITDAVSLQSIAALENLDMPRYIIQVDDDKAYLSTWGNSGEILVLDLFNYMITKTIDVGQGAEQMVKVDDKVFVANSGGFAYANTVSVIDAEKDEVVHEISTGYNPKTITSDAFGNVWVLCGGKWLDDYSGLEVPGKLVCINPLDYTVLKSFDFESLTTMPDKLSVNKAGTNLIYNYNYAVYTLDISANELPVNPIIDGSFNALEFHQNGKIYAADAGDFKSRGNILLFDTNYTSIDTIDVGVAPNGFIFVE